MSEAMSSKIAAKLLMDKFLRGRRCLRWHFDRDGKLAVTRKVVSGG